MRNLPSRTACMATCVLLPTLLSTSVAEAAPIKKRVQLQLQAAVLDHLSTDMELDESDVNVTSSSTTFGLSSRLGFGLGIGFTEHLELHLLNGFSITALDTQVDGDESENEATRLRFEMLPTLRYVAGKPESKARLFVGGGVGFLADTTEDDFTRTSSTAASFTAIIGLHAFLNDFISLDPALELSSQSINTTTENQETGLDLDASGSGFRALFTLGLTGWLGGQRAEPAQPAQRAYQPAGEPDEPVSSSLDTTEVHLDLEGMGLTISGAPFDNGRTLLVEVTHLASAAEWRGCDIELGDGVQSVPVRAHYRANATGRVIEESARGSASFHDLDRWARSSAPYVKLCGKGAVLRGYEQQRVLRTLDRFQAVSLRAGTFVEDARIAAAPAPKLLSDPEVLASMSMGVLRCVPNQASVTLRFRLSGTGVLERLEPDATRDEATSLCLAQTIMNTQFVATGEARTLEHTFVTPKPAPAEAPAPAQAPTKP